MCVVAVGAQSENESLSIDKKESVIVCVFI